MEFSKFKAAISKQFNDMIAGSPDLFVTDISKDALWETYLLSFPAGSNPIFRERAEHDCSSCKQFIRTIGNMVKIDNGRLVSIWDMVIDDPAYQKVADTMAAAVKSSPVCDLFLHYEYAIGTDHNFESCDNGGVRQWDHFAVTLPRTNDSKYVASKQIIPTRLGEARSTHDVFLRSLIELTRDAIDTVQELIDNKSLYRGQEHLRSVNLFSGFKERFDYCPEDQRDLFAWAHAGEAKSVAHIRNTALGTLLVDLSEGMELDKAVDRFEKVMAPSNYKRPTALVSKKQVEAARQEITDLGLMPALERRYARMDDINVNDIIFVDRSAKGRLKGDAFDEVATKSVTPKELSRTETIGIETFIKDVVPHVTSIELLVENKHTGNLVSLIAPTDLAAEKLFKWNNPFSWSYNGDVTDSIKERVKRAGGQIDAELCCRLAWSNYDDLDLHMIEPSEHIYYVHRYSNTSGGQLDIDMNAGSGQTREPVENIFYERLNKLRSGIYHLFVHQFAQRERSDVGFEAEIDFKGDVHRFVYDKMVRPGENITIAKFKYNPSSGIEFIESLPSTIASKEVWGIKTQDWCKVNLLLTSPNHWEREVGIGNKHYFFMLDGCANDGQARGFYNEFLRPELDKHRKVIEMVGGKMKVEKTSDQLSGLGFSTTNRNEVLVKVKGNYTRTLKVIF